MSGLQETERTLLPFMCKSPQTFDDLLIPSPEELMRASSQQVYAEQSGKMDHEYSSGAPNRSALKAEGNGES